MADSLEKVNLGMAEFIAKLIDETMEAVIDSQMRQAENIAEIKSAAFMSLSDYAETNISDEEALNYMKELFSPDAPPAEGQVPNIEKIRTLVLVELSPAHVSVPRSTKGGTSKPASLTSSRNPAVLNQAGMKFLLSAVKVNMAERHHQILQALAKDGIPRIVIDNGEINAKVSFTATSMEQHQSSSSQKKGAVTSDSKWQKMNGGTLSMKLNGNTTLIKAEKMSGEYTSYLPGTKLVIENASQSSNSSTTNLFGEITVKFKTIY